MDKLKKCLHLEKVGERELNQYDYRTCGNGGGYYQVALYYKGTRDGKPCLLEVIDTSCGDFGERYRATFKCAGEEFKAIYNEMDDIYCNELPEDVAFACYIHSGYSFPGSQLVQRYKEQKKRRYAIEMHKKFPNIPIEDFMFM